MSLRARDWLAFDREHVWHPYSIVPSAEPRYLVTGAEGVYLELADGRRLVDGMSSWWTAIVGYRHPALLRAGHAQLERLPHVMFGGLTHQPAIELAERLLALAPAGLEHVFFSDSGSVSVEVAMKMARQYFVARGEPGRQRFLALRSAYHGDTWGAMSVCDPERGMHALFAGSLERHWFAPAPASKFGAALDPRDCAPIEQLLASHAREIAALILEPIVQNAGGMRFYSAEYLRAVAELCRKHGVLLVADEIATGFGRTGRMFACEHAGVTPDILCLGKALTGGIMSLAATLTQPHVAAVIAGGTPGRFMHGPTYMGNALACSIALAVLDVLADLDWRERVLGIEAQLRRELAACAEHPAVADVRVLGAIGVVELRAEVDVQRVVPALVERGVWLRPFANLLYTMPPFVISEGELSRVTAAMCGVLE